LASYKLAESYTAYGLSLVCDLLSITLLTIGIEYGIEMKIHHREQRISVIATSIFLLMNISEVLKTIIREMLTFETFFSINLIPFIEIADAPRPLDDDGEEVQLSSLVAPAFEGHRLEFHNLLLEEPGEVLSKNSIFSLTVEEGEIVLLYEKDNRFRDLLLYALTKNLPMFNERAFFKSKSSTIRLGGVDIREVSRRDWLRQFGVIASDNFYFNGTIRENVSWGFDGYSELRALHFARLLQMEKDFPAVEPNVLSAKLTTEMKRIKNGLIKKIAVLRALLRKPRVVVLKDTDEYIETLSIVELLKQEIPAVTIIKITNFLEASLDVTRIVSMENMEILEDGHPADIKASSRSKLAEDLRDVNYASYNYRKKVGSEKRSSDKLTH
jgi:ABC-type cobalamin/Fe3+-siderophores transport system ATPase subunit